MSKAIQVYADSVQIDTNDKMVTIAGFDIAQLVKEFSVDELLSEMEFSDVADWVHQRRQEDAEE